MEDLPLGRIAALVSEFAVKDLLLGRTLMIYIYIYKPDFKISVALQCSYTFQHNFAILRFKMRKAISDKAKYLAKLHI